MKYNCSNCYEEKEEEYFHKNSRNKHGRSYLCKICDNKRKEINYYKDVEKNRLKYKLHSRERLKKNPQYRKDLYAKNRIAILAYQKKVREKNKDKINARCKLNLHILRGRIKKPNICSKCKETCEKIEAHHEDYLNALDVIWVCKKCHTLLDKEKKIREDIEKYNFIKNMPSIFTFEVM